MSESVDLKRALRGVLKALLNKLEVSQSRQDAEPVDSTTEDGDAVVTATGVEDTGSGSDANSVNASECKEAVKHFGATDIPIEQIVLPPKPRRAPIPFPELCSRATSWVKETAVPFAGRLFSSGVAWVRGNPIETSLAACGIAAAVIAAFVLSQPTIQRQLSATAMESIRHAIVEQMSADTLSGAEKPKTVTVAVSIPADTELDAYGDEYDYADIVPVRALSVLNRAQGTVDGLGVLSIEKIELELPVIEGATKQGLKVALGHVDGTASIGDVGNAVIAGHRSYTYGRFFNRLDEVEIGDVIRYTSVSGDSLMYTVYDVAVVEPGDLSVFDEIPNESKVTLVTCTPVRVASHRLVVRAVLNHAI